MFSRRISLLILAAVCSLALFLPGCSRQDPRSGTASAAAPKTVPVEAVRVSVRSAERLMEVTGTLQPYDKVTVSSEVDGTVQRVLVDLGDNVSKGQLLAEVNPEEFRIQVQQATARLQQALAQLGVKEGQDPRSIQNEDTPEVRRAISLVEEARQNYRRMKELFEAGIGTQQTMEHAEAQLKSAQANLSIAIENTETQRAQIDQFRAALQLAQKKLKDTAINAPFAGSIGERHVSVGLLVRAQTPLFTIVQINPLRLRAEVPERMAGAIRADQAVEFRVDSLPGRTFRGSIWRISPSVSEQSRTLLIEAFVRNDEEMLRPGMFTRASIRSGQMIQALMVPARAVLNFYGVNKVFTLADGKAQDRTVKVGDRYEDHFEILEGLHERELVAVSNLEKLQTGVPVQVKTP